MRDNSRAVIVAHALTLYETVLSVDRNLVESIFEIRCVVYRLATGRKADATSGSNRAATQWAVPAKGQQGHRQ